MLKHTETIRRQKPTNCLIVFGRFIGLTLKGLKLWIKDFRSKFIRLFRVFCLFLNTFKMLLFIRDFVLVDKIDMLKKNNSSNMLIIAKKSNW